MKKAISCIGFALVLSIFGLIQTASAEERGARREPPQKGIRQSREARSPKKESRLELRKDHNRQEVRFNRPAHYYKHRLPAGYRALKIRNAIFYYLNGIYYQWTPYGYQAVNAPLGAVIGQLPPGYYQIWYGGNIYYVHNNTYYVRQPVGYTVVTPPQGIILPAQVHW